MARKHDDPWVRVFDVTEPTRHRKGYTMYKVISKVFPKNLAEAATKVVVWKRYNDFKKLHKALHAIHQGLHLKGTFPPFAKARFFGRFDNDVIEERRRSALQLLEFAAQHPPLFTSQVFVKFLEGGQHVDPHDDQERSGSLIAPLESTKISPKSLRSSPYASEDTRDAAESSLLGGIWQHRQAADDISLSSHATDDDDDDRTTFTDDDSALGTPTPLSGVDIAMFDPLYEKQKSFDPLAAKDESTKHWLLSAIQSCAQDELEPESSSQSTQSYSFPKPFSDASEYDSVQSPTNREPVTQNISDEASSSTKSAACVSDGSSVLKQFDPLSGGSEKTPLPSSSNTSLPTDECFEATLLSPLSPLTPVKPFQFAEKQNYLVEAANIISQAQDSEVSGKFMLAFSYYKAAIGILLQGVQGDMNATQREAVRRKTAQYLIRAEDIYAKHLAEKVQDDKRWAADSHLSPASTLDSKVISLRGPVDELEKYKVLGVIGKVILVLDTDINETFVIKILCKSSKTSTVPNIVPQAVPYMVKLFRVYETNYAIFLVLQHATGGCLWDYVSSYLQRSPLSPCLDCAYLFSENQKDVVQTEGSESPNVYSGKKLSTNLPGAAPCDERDSEAVKCSRSFTETAGHSSSSSQSSVDSDLKAASRCSSSYTALFTKYAASAGLDQLVGLAKCNLVSNNITYSDDDEESHSVKDEPNTVSGSQHVILTPGESHTNNSTLCFKSENEPSGLLNNRNNSSPSVSYSVDSVHKVLNDIVIKNNKSNVDISGILPTCNGQQQNIPSEDSGVEQLISNSKALLKNVEQTLRDTWLISPSNGRETGESTSTITEDLPDVQVKKSAHDVLQRILSDISSASSGSRNEDQHDLLPQLKDSTQKQVDRKSSRHFHQAECRLCLSSSTGSLERTSQRVRNFSEVFKQLDIAAAQTAVTPVHLPESCVRIWMAELVMALTELHLMGIIWQDLRPDNLLLGDRGHILLTYQSQWNCVDRIISDEAVENLYAAPETGSIFSVTPSCDWWSLGAFLFELLTGRTLESCHPGGITTHTTLNIPAHVSPEGQDLLKKLLRFNASERLGSGPHGVEDIKAHPFFRDVNWSAL